MNSTSIVLLMLAALACSVTAAYVARSKNRSIVMWAAVAFILPLIGLLIITVLPKKVMAP